MNDDLVARVMAGQPRAVGQAITLVESGGEGAKDLLRRLREQAGQAHVVGVTGSPGAGKSTLINELCREFRCRGRSIGVIAVDPTSPFSGGAILGDRVRMQELAQDPEVFVRSMATRGRLGGLARATEDTVTVLDAAGKDVVIVETVGVGQDEVDVAAAAHTTIVVLVPTMGDEIQTMKAGIMEVADIFAINKADLPGAERVALQVAAIASLTSRSWEPPVVKTVALSGSGVAELVDAADRHRSHLANAEPPAHLKRELVRKRVFALASWNLMERLESEVGRERVDHLVQMVVAGEKDPYLAAEELVEGFLSAGPSVPPEQRLAWKEVS